MSESSSFDRLRSGVHRGDQDATAAMVLRQFAGRLTALAAAKIGRRLQPRVGAEDVVQSVYRTFFRRLNHGLIELRDWESLWGLMARITICRIRRLAAFHGAIRRSSEREVELLEGEAFDPQPLPEEVTVAEELSDYLFSEMPAKYLRILEHILAGFTHEEIARQLSTSIATVERVHRRARDCLAALLMT